MRKSRKIFIHTVIAAVALFAIATLGVAQEPDVKTDTVGSDAVFTPAPGTPLRKAILDALREEVRRLHGLEVVFVVTELKVKDGWAWVQTRPQSRDGLSHYEDIPALLQKRDGVWTVAELVCTEVDNPECIDSPDYYAGLKMRFPGVPEEVLPVSEESENEIQ